MGWQERKSIIAAICLGGGYYIQWIYQVIN
jgi:hypothetical protein